MRALAVAAPARSPMLPDVPTLTELGFPGIESQDYYGIIGPANLKPAIVQKVHDAFRDAMQAPELQERLRKQGIFPHLLGPAEFRKFLEDEVAKLGEIAKKAGIKGEQ
jgi:tripartite-type tricarboxylate transporter receptor subunit TctC